MSTEKKYELSFIGLGAANCLIIRSLCLSGFLSEKKISIFEPDSKNQNDKTYCFWATPDEVEKMQVVDLVDISWSKVSCRKARVDEIAPLRYYHISSLTLYESVRKILTDFDVDFYSENVETILREKGDSFNKIQTETKTVFSKWIFDSRPPIWKERKSNQTFLWQSFLGWKIKTPAPCFDTDVFTMMDFETDQSDSTQFIYILPYSNDHALVELTRFGIHCIDHEYARGELKKYCEKKNWEYSIQEEEKGKIPMSSLEIENRSVHDNHIQTGSAAGKIKPTTGYAFKEMAFDALEIRDSLMCNISFQREEKRKSRKGRFAYYDRLLLKILETKAGKGKLIFTELFRNVNTPKVLKFLEQKTTFIEDLSILSALPKKLFISEALRDFKKGALDLKSSILALLTTLVFLLFNLLGLDNVNMVILMAGLFLIGIPHGAMDHILAKNRPSSLMKFISGFLIQGALVFCIWKISPLWGLIFFLLYSAWHFGQSDFEQWNKSTGIRSFIWGIGVLGFLLFSHFNETIKILAQLVDKETLMRFSSLSDSHLWMVFVVLMSIFFVRNFTNEQFICFSTILALTFLPLLQAFGIYFIFQHSLSGWTHIKSRLHKTDRELWIHAMPFTIGAFFLFFIFFTNQEIAWQEQTGSFFIFLSCISFPHVLNMHRFYFSKN